MGEEHRDKGVDVQLGPVVGPLGRVPAAGRNWEGKSVFSFGFRFCLTGSMRRGSNGLPGFSPPFSAQQGARPYCYLLLCLVLRAAGINFAGHAPFPVFSFFVLAP